MNLGTFSVSLTVKGTKQYRKSHEDLGFDESTTRPASGFLKDLDGSLILIDEHDPDYKPISEQ